MINILLLKQQFLHCICYYKFDFLKSRLRFRCLNNLLFTSCGVRIVLLLHNTACTFIPWFLRGQFSSISIIIVFIWCWHISVGTPLRHSRSPRSTNYIFVSNSEYFRVDCVVRYVSTRDICT